MSARCVTVIEQAAPSWTTQTSQTAEPQVFKPHPLVSVYKGDWVWAYCSNPRCMNRQPKLFLDPGMRCWNCTPLATEAPPKQEREG